MPSKFSFYLLSTTRSKFSHKLQRLNVRRSLVTAGALWLLVMGLAFLYVYQNIWLLVAIDVPFLALAFLLTLSVYSLFELPDDELDELQVAIRNDAYKGAYGKQ